METTVIELKYKTQGIKLTVDNETFPNETFSLKNQSAQPQDLYDFWKDVERIEGQNSGGYVILLTNDNQYWEESENSNVKDKDFRLHDNRDVNSNELKWQNDPAEGTIEGREDPINLRNNYKIEWCDYYSDKRTTFRYLLLEVKGKQN